MRFFVKGVGVDGEDDGDDGALAVDGGAEGALFEVQELWGSEAVGCCFSVRGQSGGAKRAQETEAINSLGPRSLWVYPKSDLLVHHLLCHVTHGIDRFGVVLAVDCNVAGRHEEPTEERDPGDFFFGHDGAGFREHLGSGM